MMMSLRKRGVWCFIGIRLFFGLGSEAFEYCTGTLQEAILREMEREDWVGACCEPNAVFVVCNQSPVSLDVFAWRGG